MNSFYNYPVRPDDVMHFGVKRKSGRYPWGSGERPYQGDSPDVIRQQKAERAAKRKESVKNAAKSVGKLALRSALFGATVAAKVVFSSAITSATLVGIASVGFQTINSPEFTSLVDHAMVSAGNWFVDTYVRRGVSYADSNLELALSQGEAYLNEIDKKYPSVYSTVNAIKR